MPLWETKEIKKCIKSRRIGKKYMTLKYLQTRSVPNEIFEEFNYIFKKYGLEIKSSLFDLFGYTVRFLLKKNCPREELQEVFKNMLSPDFDNIFNKAKLLIAKDKLLLESNHHLFHMDVSEDCQSFHNIISGRKVKEAIQKSFRNMNNETLYEIYKEFKTNQQRFGYVVGGIFEILLERTVKENIDITRRFLPETLKIKGITINMDDIFNKIGMVKEVDLESLETKIEENVLYSQNKNNWETVDYILLLKLNQRGKQLYCLFGIQVTIGKTHTINATGIKRIKIIIDNFEKRERITLHYIHLFIIQNLTLFKVKKKTFEIEKKKNYEI
jgi:hypothetical protein